MHLVYHHLFQLYHTLFNVFSAVTNLAALVKTTVQQSNLYAQQNDRESPTNKKKVRRFWGSTMSWLLKNYNPMRVIGNSGSALEKMA